MPELLSERIRRLRKERHMPLRTLASAMNVSISHVSNVEAGARRLYAGHVAPLASILGVTSHYLLTGEEEPKVAILYRALESARAAAINGPFRMAALAERP